jgi:transposase
LPECFDNFIDKSNPVRAIDVFVDTLDGRDELRLSGAGGDRSTVYDPSVLLKRSLRRGGGLGL